MEPATRKWGWIAMALLFSASAGGGTESQTHLREAEHAEPATVHATKAPTASTHEESGEHGAPNGPAASPEHGTAAAGGDHSPVHAQGAAEPVDHGASPSGSDGHGTPSGGHEQGKSAVGHKAHAPDPAKELLRKRREDADSGYLAGVLPRRAVVWKPRKAKILHLESDVVVGPGQSLEIAAGTEIRVAARDRAPMGAGDWADSQFVSLIVRGGSLRLLGTADKPIRFVPERGGKGVRWGGLEILDVGARSQVEVSWVQIPGALRGVAFERATGVVRHAVIDGGNVGIAVRGGGSPEVVHSVLTRNAVAGLHSEKSGPRARGCLFYANTGAGAKFDGVGLARLENNGFWNNAGGDIVRGPARTGGWVADSLVVPDVFGNVRTDPVLASSALHAALMARKRDSLRTAPVWRRRLPDPPPGKGPWALSPFSPLLDRGSASPVCRDRDGSACDIGLWGGTD
jgi:hypothetical protein